MQTRQGRKSKPSLHHHHASSPQCSVEPPYQRNAVAVILFPPGALARRRSWGRASPAPIQRTQACLALCLRAKGCVARLTLPSGGEGWDREARGRTSHSARHTRASYRCAAQDGRTISYCKRGVWRQRHCHRVGAVRVIYGHHQRNR